MNPRWNKKIILVSLNMSLSTRRIKLKAVEELELGEERDEEDEEDGRSIEAKRQRVGEVLPQAKSLHRKEVFVSCEDIWGDTLTKSGDYKVEPSSSATALIVMAKSEATKVMKITFPDINVGDNSGEVERDIYKLLTDHDFPFSIHLLEARRCTGFSKICSEIKGFKDAVNRLVVQHEFYNMNHPTNRFDSFPDFRVTGVEMRVYNADYELPWHLLPDHKPRNNLIEIEGITKHVKHSDIYKSCLGAFSNRDAPDWHTKQVNKGLHVDGHGDDARYIEFRAQVDYANQENKLDTVNIVTLEKGGETLRETQKKKLYSQANPLKFFYDILAQLLFSLAYFDQLGIEHNDLHSGNVLLIRNTGNTQFHLQAVDEAMSMVIEPEFVVKIFDFDRSSKVKRETNEYRNKALDLRKYCKNYGQCHRHAKGSNLSMLQILHNIYRLFPPLEVKRLIQDIVEIDAVNPQSEIKWNGKDLGHPVHDGFPCPKAWQGDCGDEVYDAYYTQLIKMPPLQALQRLQAKRKEWDVPKIQPPYINVKDVHLPKVEEAPPRKAASQYVVKNDALDDALGVFDTQILHTAMGLPGLPKNST